MLDFTLNQELQLSNYSKNVMLAWFFHERSAFQDFEVCIRFSKWQLNLVPDPNDTKSALAVKATMISMKFSENVLKT